MTLSPLNEEYTVGDRVNCTADGNPAPTIKWQVIESNTIGGNVGTALLITNAMVVSGNEFSFFRLLFYYLNKD